MRIRQDQLLACYKLYVAKNRGIASTSHSRGVRSGDNTITVRAYMPYSELLRRPA